MAPCQVICAYTSLGAGLLDAVVDRQTTLLIAYDSEYPQPLFAKRPVPDVAGVGLVLAPQRTERSLAQITVAPDTANAEPLADAALEDLRRHPGPACLAAVAQAGTGRGRGHLPRLPAADAAGRRHPAVLDRAWIAAHIPHQGSMCLLDAVREWSGEAITCTASSHTDPANPLRADGRLGAANGIEYAAQAMAIHGALLAGDGSEAASRARAT